MFEEGYTLFEDGYAIVARVQGKVVFEVTHCTSGQGRAVLSDGETASDRLLAHLGGQPGLVKGPKSTQSGRAVPSRPRRAGSRHAANMASNQPGPGARTRIAQVPPRLPACAPQTPCVP
jgi:hypothetical protein